MATLGGSHHGTMEGSTSRFGASNAARSTFFYPAELHYIKSLFNRQQYHQCINACRDLLAILTDGGALRPLQDTFALFYLALSHDELARVMHQDSKAKLPSYRAAELFYLEALGSLPSSDEAHTFITNAASPSLGYSAPANPSSSPRSTVGPTSSRQASDSTLGLLRSPAMSASPFISDDSDVDRSISQGSLVMPGPEHDHQESHPSSDQIMTPSRLQRDYSSMSLLDHVPSKRKSMTHGLLRPIRLGSPPKQFHVPPSLPYSGQYRPSLPRLNTNPPVRTPVHDIASARSSQFSSPEPEEPVSPLGPEEIASDTSTISPVSPTTPTIPNHLAHPSGASDAACDIRDDRDMVDDAETHSEGEFEDVTEDHGESHSEASFEFSEHFQDSTAFQNGVEDMRAQLRRHVVLVQGAKAHYLHVQTKKRSAKVFSEAIVSRLKDASYQNGAKDVDAGKEQGFHKYVACVSAEIKNMDRQERVRAGRERRWERKKFEPGRYRDLCERALAEL